MQASDFGKAWPLTVSASVISCLPGAQIVFQAGGKTYAMNGLAIGAADRNGWQDIRKIWKSNPKLGIPGAKVDIRPLLGRAVSFCEI